MTPQSAPTRSLDPVTLYGILALRSAVFVVEQNCVFLDLDGRDLESDCVQWWIEDAGRVVVNLRVLGGDDVHEVGRVVTDPAYRGRGLAGLLTRHALASFTGPVVLKAQAHLAGWYEGFGFSVDGPAFDEDGILHVPMLLDR